MEQGDVENKISGENDMIMVAQPLSASLHNDH